jgi:hypothetical protein
LSPVFNQAFLAGLQAFLREREGINTHVLHQEMTVGLETSREKGAYLEYMQVHGGPIKVPQDLAWEATLEKASNRELTSTVYK